MAVTVNGVAPTDIKVNGTSPTAIKVNGEVIWAKAPIVDPQG